MHNTLRLLRPIPLLQLTALLQAIPVQLVDILQPLMAGRAMATAQDPTSCAKLSERARLVTVAPTLSPMPNGKPLSSASGTAESASSAIAFRRTDYWLKPRRNASARLSLRTPRTTREARHEGIREELAAAVTKSPGASGAFFNSASWLLRRQLVGQLGPFALERPVSFHGLLMCMREFAARRAKMDAILRKNHMADAAARAAPKSSNR